MGEKQALDASEAWDTVITDFLAYELVTAAESRFKDRADIGVLKVGGYSSAARARFVLTNPGLLDSMGTADELAAEYAVLLRLSASFDKSGNKFGTAGRKIPNLLAEIGIGFDQVGDILFDEGSGGNKADGVAYIVCEPSVQKTIERLLPKKLGRVTIDITEPGF